MRMDPRRESPLAPFACSSLSAPAPRQQCFHICEIQLVHKRMATVRREMGGHEGYSSFRAAEELLEEAVAADGGQAMEMEGGRRGGRERW